MNADPKAAAFFYEHAPFTDNREQNAIALATAEWWAVETGVTFTWSDDWEVGSHREFYGPDSAYADSEPDTCEQVTARLGDLSASLDCVDDADDDYRRVVQAELAAELREAVGPRGLDLPTSNPNERAVPTMPHDIIIAKRTDVHPLPDRRRFTATSQLHQLAGNASPHFSVTGDLENMRYKPDSPHRLEACGCLHDDAVRYFPDLAPVVLVHLADDKGRPMHALENAIYWSGLSVWSNGEPALGPDSNYGRTVLETDSDGLVWAPDTLARHLRVTVERAREMRAYVISAGGSDREGWRFVFRGLEQQWQREADTALAIIRAGMRPDSLDKRCTTT